MYSRQQVSVLKKEFWTVFGQYMSPVPSADGKHINWLNYKTGVKNIYFRMDADRSSAAIAIEIAHNDETFRLACFNQFRQLHSVLFEAMEEQWHWASAIVKESGKPVSRIYKEMPGVNILDKEKWPQLISFFKPRIIALDKFWCNARTAFEN